MAAIAAQCCCLLSGAAAAGSLHYRDDMSAPKMVAALRPLSYRKLPSSEPSLRRRQQAYKGPSALFGSLDRSSGGSDNGKKDDKKFITKEQEPEQYWQTADEKAGKNPMSTLLPYIVILSVLSPFIILAVAFANNWIKIPIR